MPGNPITIRALGPEDAEVLDRVKDGVFAAPIEPFRAFGVLATRVNEVLVARDEGQVIGYACGTVLMRPDQPSSFLISAIGVHEGYRRQGVGRRLTTRLMDSASERGCLMAWGLVEPENMAAHQFCKALGGTASLGGARYNWQLG